MEKALLVGALIAVAVKIQVGKLNPTGIHLKDEVQW